MTWLYSVQILFEFIQIMSGLFPQHGGRTGEWDFCHGPWTHGQLPDEVDPDDDTVPPVDHSDIGYDEWGH